MLSSAAATVITEPVAFSLAVSVLDASDLVVTLVVLLAILALVADVLLVVVVIVAIAVVGLVVTLVNEDVNADDVVLSVVVFFVGRGLVDVSKWDVVI